MEVKVKEAYQIPEAYLAVYARCPRNGSYPDGLARSIHFAVSRDGRVYEPLHSGYGMLFATGEVGSDNTIQPLGVKNPRIFQAGKGQFGITAVRVLENGEADESSRGKILLWLTNDLEDFGKEMCIDLKMDRDVEVAICHLEEETGTYSFLWKDTEGGCWKNETQNPSDAAAMSEAAKAVWEEEQGVWKPCFMSEGLQGEACCLPWKEQMEEDALPGNQLPITRSLCDRLALRWGKLRHVGVRLPEKVEVSSIQDVEAVKACAVYSDGSTALKEVEWETKEMDFSQPGEYEIKGKIAQENLPFPLAEGFADPVIMRRDGMYYFLSTNDNTDDVGLYVREADSLEDLFAPDVRLNLILDKNEEKGFVQTFWAPEFHEIGGRLYILFAISGKVWGPQCHMMRLKEGGCITDPDGWEEPVRVVRKDGSALAAEGITLDMTYLQAGGRSYLIWSYRNGINSPLDTGSMLMIARTDEKEPWKLTSDPVLLSRPLYGWENVEHTINNEGPYAFMVGDEVYLTYSGGAANGYTYVVGLLRASAQSDLLDGSSWKKEGAPVLSFYSVEGEYGPGHNSFFVDKDGSLRIAYHGETAIDGNLRCSGIRRIHFDLQGRPRFDLSAERDLDPALRQVRMNVRVR